MAGRAAMYRRMPSLTLIVHTDNCRDSPKGCDKPIQSNLRLAYECDVRTGQDYYLLAHSQYSQKGV
jgi:hypothetical protein